MHFVKLRALGKSCLCVFPGNADLVWALEKELQTLTEEQWCFWDLLAIGSDRDEDSKSSLPFTNLDNYTQCNAMAGFRKFSGSLGSFPNFWVFIWNEPVTFCSSSSANKKKSITVIILMCPPRRMQSEGTPCDMMSLENGSKYRKTLSLFKWYFSGKLPSHFWCV